ncbi:MULTISPECIES: hypothetical protein [unclassified Thioclava]|uniref:hypothetical protein n=1 Tax=unclassified Thioclava TaxID=2621713 RepID=UPI000995E413|nr:MULTISPECIES: hypothetical protein [unclassified Thioclava]MPQ94067.1 hypothetical protein [Thioclava sp. JE_KL1]OOY08633.1 hypothetical protein BMI89_10705 [Thioclava sp. F36-7]OOY15965.1 hypothetical protein BMI85_10530 [Thioclava sp. DLFJ4-1]OOY30457.1 hypothetical protein BMI88_14890 [Thioclava sp. F36-6]
MKNLLIILGVTAALAGCETMTGPAASDMTDEAMMAPAGTSTDTTDTSGTHTNTNTQDRSREQASQ